MRTTITLDDDVVEKLKAETLRSGRSFKETVNRVIRRGLLTGSAPREAPGLHKGRELGLRPGIDLDNIEELLDQVEGPARR
jgi:plasmid stability protein